MNVRNWLVTFAFLVSIPALSQKTEGKNVGKVNLSAFVLKGIGLQYERQVGKKITVALAYSNIPTTTLPFQSYIKNQINAPSVNISQFKLGTLVFTPEARFYLGKKGAFEGFYLAPYARISNYKLNGPVNFTVGQEATRSALFSGKLTSFTGGLMAGSSFSLSKIIYLDWWIAGASIGAGKGNFSAKIDLTAEEQESLKNVLDKVNIPFTSIENTVNSDGARVTTKGKLVGLRGLGINLGIRF